LIETENDLIAYRIACQSNMKLAVSPPGRDWMNETFNGFANRCLPMRMASQAGWVVLNDRPIRAKWSGHSSTKSITIECEGSAPYAAISHFGEGVLTFIIPFLFRTPAGVSLLVRGPANMPKDAIAPLEALVETDWAVAGASVNWKFTRPNAWVEFARDEPICMIVPQHVDHLETFNPRVIGMEKDPETHKAYSAWNKSCKDFNARLRERDPEALRQGWLRNYFRGTAPHVAPEPMPEASNHRTRLDLKNFAGMTPAHPVQPRSAPAEPATAPNHNGAQASDAMQPHRSPALQALGICPYQGPDTN
jgi:hypothetical protein